MIFRLNRTTLQSKAAYTIYFCLVLLFANASNAFAQAAPNTPDLQGASDSGSSNTDNITNVTSPTFDITGCTDGNLVEIIEAATSRGTGTCTGGVAVITVNTTLSNNTHTITAQQSANGGATYGTSSAGITITVDANEPTPGIPDLQASNDTGNSNTDNLTNIDSPNYDITCNNDSTVELLEGTTVLGSATCINNLVSIESEVLLDGSHSVRSRQTDVAGNVSNFSSTLAVIIDTGSPTTPARPNLNPGSDTGQSNTDDLTNDITPEFNVGCTTGTVTVFEGETPLGTGTCMGGFANVTTTFVEPSDGVHTVAAYQTDAAGNVGQNGPSFSFTFDTTATEASGTPDLVSDDDSGLSDEDNNTNDNTPSFTVVCTEEGSTVEVLNGMTALGFASCVDGSATITSSALADGTYMLVSHEIDIAANVSDNSAPLSVTIDTTAPATPGNIDLEQASDSGVNTDDITNKKKPNFIIPCAEEGNRVQILDIIGSANCDMGFASVAPDADLSDDDYTITSIEVDVAGNASAESHPFDFTIDTTPTGTTGTPDLQAGSDTGVSNTDNRTTDTTPTFTITCQINGDLVELVNGTTVLGSGTCSGELVAITSSVLVDGTYSVFGRETDFVANVSANSGTLSVVIDTTAPNAPTITQPSEDEFVETITPTFAGTGEANTTITVIDEEARTVGTVTVAGDGTWSVVSSENFTDGEHTVVAKGTDSTSNMGMLSDIRTFTVDPDTDGDGVLDSQENGKDDADGDESDNDEDSSTRASTVLSSKYVVPWNGFLSQVNIGEVRNNSGTKSIKVRTTMRDRLGNNQQVVTTTIAANGQNDLNYNSLQGFAVNDYGTVLIEGFEMDGTTPVQPGDFTGQVSVYRLIGNSFADIDYAYAVPFTGGKAGEQFAAYNTFQPSLNPIDQQNMVANYAQLLNLETTAVTGDLVFYDQAGNLVQVSPGVFQLPINLAANQRIDYPIHDLVGANKVGSVRWIPSSGFEDKQISLQVTRYFFASDTFVVTDGDSFTGAFTVDAAKPRGSGIVLPMDTSSLTTAIAEVVNVSEDPITLTIQTYDKAGVLKNTVTGTLAPRATFHNIGDSFLASDVGSMVVASTASQSLYANVVHYPRVASGSILSARSVRGSDALGAPISASINSFLSQGCNVIVSNSGTTTESVTVNRFNFTGASIGSPIQISLNAKASMKVDTCAGFPVNSYGKAQLVSSSPQARIAANAVRTQTDYTMATEVNP